MRKVTIAATQMMCSTDRDENITKAETLVREAASRGAQIILLQELFETLYFCQSQKQDFFSLATEIQSNPGVQHFSALARQLRVVLPISFFEKKNQAYYNTVAVVDADGAILGIYRKSHIPGGPGYQEKFYFSPGDTGFRVWKTRYGTIGIGICWDQWFPEAARIMVLTGAEILLYPTAIGSEPQNPEYDSRDHWQTCMQGHAAANMVPIVVSNRVGTESIDGSTITFYGSSFIADGKGRLLERADRTSESIVSAEFDLETMAAERSAWGLFRDRRPTLYTPLLTHDGGHGPNGS
jgi:N-carbamoylputrescine amidase